MKSGKILPKILLLELDSQCILRERRSKDSELRWPPNRRQVFDYVDYIPVFSLCSVEAEREKKMKSEVSSVAFKGFGKIHRDNTRECMKPKSWKVPTGLVVKTNCPFYL